LVYNLGGGALSLAIISLQEQVFEVKSMGGDTNLGTEDFLQRLVEYCHEEFKLHSGGFLDMSKDARALIKLRHECETAMWLLAE